MKTSSPIPYAAGVCLLVAVNLAVGQGPLTPPGAPAPGMKTLAQIEPRTPISALPFTISVPGSYYVTTNLVGISGTNGITILANDVTLDLNGFALIGVVGSSNGIQATSLSLTNLAIRNGTIKGWGGDGVSGSFSAPFVTVETRNSLFEDLRLSKNGGNGLRVGGNSIVKQCSADSNGAIGINAGYASSVTDCAALSNGGVGILAGSSCVGKNCTASLNTGDGIVASYASSVLGCSAQSNTGKGITTSGRNTVKDCTVVNNSGIGFDVGSQSTIKDCTATANSNTGISGGAESIISGCTASQNGSVSSGDGILVASYCLVLENNCGHMGGAGSGLHVTGNGNLIERNHASFCTGTGIKVDGTGNLIVKNSAFLNTGADYNIVAGNKDAQVLTPTTGFSSTNSWANLSF